MNIKRAKQEIKQSIQAYLAKNEFGEYKIPVNNQRPIFLMGPPGIGKTAIMEQIARECKIGLVSYTITHHTRQSAVGLPYIQKKVYGDKEYSITEYTMSEIIASIYETMETTGLREGILFIDEVNCVSETLSATMLQFLQQKTFGNHRVPKGWVIVTAGNPVEYNKSVREYDVVTLDRIRTMDVTPDYNVWKEYAYQNSVHPAIITYLDLKVENFYRMETSVDGVKFITPRGWEDLSKLLYLYEELHMEVNTELIQQYIQHPTIAKDFSNYLDFYIKYRETYPLDQLLTQPLTKETVQIFATSTFDEKLTVLGLILDRLYHECKDVLMYDRYVKELYECLKQLKHELSNVEDTSLVYPTIERWIERIQEEVDVKKKSWHMDSVEAWAWANVLKTISGYQKEIRYENIVDSKEAFEWVKRSFEHIKRERMEKIEAASNQMNAGFRVVEQCYGISQELVIFVTELTMNPYSANFIASYGNETYEQYSKELLYRKETDHIQEEIRELFAELQF